jgi:hypothetical protein
MIYVAIIIHSKVANNDFYFCRTILNQRALVTVTDEDVPDDRKLIWQNIAIISAC